MLFGYNAPTAHYNQTMFLLLLACFAFIRGNSFAFDLPLLASLSHCPLPEYIEANIIICQIISELIHINGSFTKATRVNGAASKNYKYKLINS